MSDETAVLKEFEWPETKYDTMREALALYNLFMTNIGKLKNWKVSKGESCEDQLKKMERLHNIVQQQV